MCNNNIKFGLFLKKFGKKFDKVATGHYAQILKKKDIYYLKKSPDQVKDQTYFLANLKQNQIKKLLFPIGHLVKEDVRKLAKKYNLPNQDRKDSQGICFLGKFKYSEFIKHYLGTKKGDFIDYDSNQKIGEHHGYWYYTIGQRKGIGLSGGPWFVVQKDLKKNIVYVSKKYHEQDKKRDTFKISKFNFFSGKLPTSKNSGVKLRHGPQTYKCKVLAKTKTSATIQINKNDQGIAPGQFAVFYEKDLCLGSAMII